MSVSPQGFILLTCLSSWFHSHSSVLNWFKSYLSSSFFHIRCNNTFSSLHTSSLVFPKAPFSVLCFSSCTLPLSSHFTRPTLTQVLPTYKMQIASWMTASLLTLNSSKTEFLLIGLKKQLDKIHNFSLNTTHSACNLCFISDEHLTFSNQISAISKACYYHIRQLH